MVGRWGLERCRCLFQLKCCSENWYKTSRNYNSDKVDGREQEGGGGAEKQLSKVNVVGGWVDGWWCWVV